MEEENFSRSQEEEKKPKDALLGKLFSDFDADFGAKNFPYKLVLEEKLP